MGDRRTATFFCISDTDSTYNFLVALAFSQMFNLLCERADNVHGGRLPHHVRVLWDEAANTGQVPNLEKLVAVIRSREISLCLLYQQLAQCKAIYGCDHMTADAEFLLSKAKYKAATGREQRRDADVLCYQIRQSFKPGEITPEEANRIGYETAMRWTKGKYAFFVATHTDKAHIHNHIYYNSTSLDCTRKFRDFIGSGRAVRRLSDRICLENDLSVITDPTARPANKPSVTDRLATRHISLTVSLIRWCGRSLSG